MMVILHWCCNSSPVKAEQGWPLSAVIAITFGSRLEELRVAVASTLRNHHAAARRCMAIVTASGQALLSSWMAWQKVASSSSPGGYAIEPDGPEQLRQQQSQQQHNALLKSCASAIAAVWVAVADQSDLSRCVVIVCLPTSLLIAYKLAAL